MSLAVCYGGVAARGSGGCVVVGVVVGVAVEAEDLAHVDGDSGPVPGGGVLVCFGVPEAEEEGRLKEGGSVGCVVVHGLFFFRFCTNV